jgi:hypothetical protein
MCAGVRFEVSEPLLGALYSHCNRCRRPGEIDGDPGIRPTAHQFTDDAASWEPIPEEGLPRFPERLPAGTRPLR